MVMFPPGKLPNDLLARLLARLGRSGDPRVLLGPRVGEDAAVVDMGENLLVVSADPITFAAEQPGWYAVQVNANDVATRGARPLWFLAVLLLPETGTDEELAAGLFEQIGSACAALGCTLIGGHTEITFGLDRPIVVGQMLGQVRRENLVSTAGARPGDALLLPKGIALEGTALLARERAAELADAGIPPDLLARAGLLLHSPGISVVQDALTATAAAPVHAMHDPTEGGLATGAAEMAEASGLGVRLNGEAIPVLPECTAICRALGLDPLGLLASGSLLIAVDPEDQGAVIAALGAVGIAGTRIGEMTAPGQGLRIETREGLTQLPRFARDEITRVLGAETPRK